MMSILLLIPPCICHVYYRDGQYHNIWFPVWYQVIRGHYHDIDIDADTDQVFGL